MISVMGLCWVFGYVPMFFNEDEPNDDTTTKKTTFIDVINWIFVVLAAFQVVLYNFFSASNKILFRNLLVCV